MTYEAEYTDTFGGEANYSWVRRETFDVKEKNHSRAQIMRAAKKAMDLTGVRGRTEVIEDTFAFYPSGSCTVMFVSWTEKQVGNNG